MSDRRKVGEPLPYCEIAVLRSDSHEKNWCVDHLMEATHCAPNGDDVVCEAYAEEEGCNCCPKNYGKAEMNERLHRFMWENLQPEAQDLFRREFDRRVQKEISDESEGA